MDLSGLRVTGSFPKKLCQGLLRLSVTVVGLSFYAFFANKNDNPELLMEAAQWWIETHEFDRFEKAAKIKAVVLAND